MNHIQNKLNHPVHNKNIIYIIIFFILYISYYYIQGYKYIENIIYLKEMVESRKHIYLGDDANVINTLPLLK